MTRFSWNTFDVRSLLPTDWQEQILAVAREYAVGRNLVTGHTTSREARPDSVLRVQTVSGITTAQHLPWLRQHYETTFLELAQMASEEEVSVMSDERFGCVLSVQGDGERYECHVDTNPIEGLLYATTHREGEGGELVVGNRVGARSVEEVDADVTVIEPKAGYLLFFDGRQHSHYVTPLTKPGDIRVVVAMNYYVPSWSEKMRAIGLNRHLSGHD